MQRLLRKLSKMEYTIWKLLKWYDQQWSLWLKNKWSDLSFPDPKGSNHNDYVKWYFTKCVDLSRRGTLRRTMISGWSRICWGVGRSVNFYSDDVSCFSFPWSWSFVNLKSSFYQRSRHQVWFLVTGSWGAGEHSSLQGEYFQQSFSIFSLQTIRTPWVFKVF